jgi:hypothetical protein
MDLEAQRLAREQRWADEDRRFVGPKKKDNEPKLWEIQLAKKKS